MVPAALDLLDHRPTLLDPHGPLEGEAVGGRLRVRAALAGRLARHVHRAELRHHVLVARVRPLVQHVVEHAEILHVDHLHVVVVDGQGLLRLLAVPRLVRVVKHDGGRPVAPKVLVVHVAAIVARLGPVVHEGHHHHGRAPVVLGHVQRRLLERARPRLGIIVVLVQPVHVRVVLAAVVPVVRDVPHADEVLLVEHNRPLVVLVRHAPDAVHGVVVHAQLRLPPQRVAQRIPAQPHDHAQHVVLDVWPHNHQLHVLHVRQIGRPGHVTLPRERRGCLEKQVPIHDGVGWPPVRDNAWDGSVRWICWS